MPSWLTASISPARMLRWGKVGLMIAGAISVARLALNSLRFLWKHFGPSADLAKYGAHKGAYVLVTGIRNETQVLNGAGNSRFG